MDEIGHAFVRNGISAASSGEPAAISSNVVLFLLLVVLALLIMRFMPADKKHNDNELE